MLLCKGYYNSSLASLSLGCAAPAFCKLGLCLSCLTGVFSSLEKTTLPTTPSGRGSLPGCFLLRERCWNPPVVLHRFWEKYSLFPFSFGHIGTSSGLLILPVAKSSWLPHWILETITHGCLLSFPSVSMSCSVLKGIYISKSALNVWTGPSFRLDLRCLTLGQVGIWRLFFLHYVPCFKKNDP